MLDDLPPAAPAASRSSRRRGRPAESNTPVRGDLRPRLLRISTVPATATTLLGAGAVAFLVLAKPADPVSGWSLGVLIAAAAGSAVALLAAVGRARAADRWVHRRVDTIRSSSVRGEMELWQLVDQLRRPGQPELHRQGSYNAAASGDVFELLSSDLERYRQNAVAVIQATTAVPSEAPDQRVGVFVNLARRLQSLVHREIQLLDELEAQVEDPDLLKGLFSVDHLATRIRRHAENLAVLGGAVPRRQWSRPVTMYEILRSAVAEVEQYSRVKLVQPTEGNLRGHSIADIVHLIAELVENATMFSAPTTQVLLRAQRVTAGLAIEVEDRGLGMSVGEREQMNLLLADPGRIDVGELLDDGRIGLFVVSSLARRHGIAVQLQSNIYGGTQAVVVLPHALLGSTPQDDEESADEQTQAIPVTAQEPVLAPVGQAVSYGSREPAYATDHARADAGFQQSPGPRPVAAQAPVGRGSLPVREPGIARAPERGTTQVHHRPPPAEPVRSAAPEHNGAADTAGDPRPELPRRNQQTHLAPQLRDAPTGRPDDDVPGYNPGLMAAYQRGVSRFDAVDRPTDGDPDVNFGTS